MLNSNTYIFYVLVLLMAVVLRRIDRLIFLKFLIAPLLGGDEYFSTNISLLPEFLTVQKRYFEFQNLELRHKIIRWSNPRMGINLNNPG